MARSLMLHKWVGHAWSEQEWAWTYRGCPAVLMCGGPSLSGWDSAALSRPGVLLAAINNSALKARPHLWITGDRPASFCPELLMDPGVVKVARVDGSASPAMGARQWGSLPSTWFYTPSESATPADMLWERPEVPYMLNTLMASLHMLWAMGVPKVALAGCDLGGSARYFHGGTPGGTRAAENAGLYAQQRVVLRSWAPRWRDMGLEVVDCSPGRPLAGACPWMDPADAAAMRPAGWPAEPCDPKALPHGVDAWEAARMSEGEWAM
jgi:hypothetical protein